MKEIFQTIEAVLFVASRPMTDAEIAKAAGVSKEEVASVLSQMIAERNTSERGIWIMHTGGAYTLSSAPHMAEKVSAFVHDEAAGELTKAQLETLTVIAYKGPVTRSEIEQLRGVNCSVILRILLLRDLIAEEDGPLEPVYSLSVAALAHLGIANVADLPEYDLLHSHTHLEVSNQALPEAAMADLENEQAYNEEV